VSTRKRTAFTILGSRHETADEEVEAGEQGTARGRGGGEGEIVTARVCLRGSG